MSNFLHSLPWTIALALAQAGDAGAALSLAPVEGAGFMSTLSGFSSEAEGASLSAFSLSLDPEAPEEGSRD